MSDGHPFEDFRTLLDAFPKADAQILSQARKRNSVLTKPPGSLGSLDEIATSLA
ncbi:MAG: nicotinate-nucleotide--dimethylbenzimidazole phosphoribosyltransferase, partial [Martelella sp.]